MLSNPFLYKPWHAPKHACHPDKKVQTKFCRLSDWVWTKAAHSCDSEQLKQAYEQLRPKAADAPEFSGRLKNFTGCHGTIAHPEDIACENCMKVASDAVLVTSAVQFAFLGDLSKLLFCYLLQKDEYTLCQNYILKDVLFGFMINVGFPIRSHYDLIGLCFASQFKDPFTRVSNWCMRPRIGSGVGSL